MVVICLVYLVWFYLGGGVVDLLVYMCVMLEVSGVEVCMGIIVVVLCEVL